MPTTKAGEVVPPRGITKTFNFWQDREIRFDSSFSADMFKMRPNAEEVVTVFNHVEDTKGNTGIMGVLQVTNLRLIWWSDKTKAVNLSIGFHCVLNVTVQETQSKLFAGPAEALFVACKFGSTRFMFVFTHVPGNHAAPTATATLPWVARPFAGPTATTDGGGGGGGGGGRQQQQQSVVRFARLHSAVSAAWKAYDATNMYRELRMRAAIFTAEGGTLQLLEREKVLSKVSEVVNVSKDSGHPGTLYTTNLRVVWVAASTVTFNVSIPFMQFTAVRSQTSKFGPALVIETSSYAGSFVLGFRVTPPERLAMLYQEIASLWKAWTAKPVMGMQVDTTRAAAAAAESNADNHDECDGDAFYIDGESGDGRRRRASNKYNARTATILEQAPSDAFAAYYADEGQKGADRRPTYDVSIGLAVEKLRKGVTLHDLWSVTVT